MTIITISKKDIQLYQNYATKNVEYGYTFRLERDWDEEEFVEYYKDDYNEYLNTVPIKLRLFQLIKGETDGVTIPEEHRFIAHTHPIHIYGDIKYHPPTWTDFMSSIYDYASGTWWNIVFEQKGSWIFRPNKNLILKIIKIWPTFLKDNAKGLPKGIDQVPLNIPNEFDNLREKIEEIISDLGLKMSGQTVDISISVQEYISQIYDIGFIVKYFPLDTEINFNVKNHQIDMNDKLLFDIPIDTKEKHFLNSPFSIYNYPMFTRYTNEKFYSIIQQRDAKTVEALIAKGYITIFQKDYGTSILNLLNTIPHITSDTNIPEDFYKGLVDSYIQGLFPNNPFIISKVENYLKLTLFSSVDKRFAKIVKEYNKQLETIFYEYLEFNQKYENDIHDLYYLYDKYGITLHKERLFNISIMNSFLVLAEFLKNDLGFDMTRKLVNGEDSSKTAIKNGDYKMWELIGDNKYRFDWDLHESVENEVYNICSEVEDIDLNGDTIGIFEDLENYNKDYNKIMNYRFSERRKIKEYCTEITKFGPPNEWIIAQDEYLKTVPKEMLESLRKYSYRYDKQINDLCKKDFDSLLLEDRRFLHTMDIIIANAPPVIHEFIVYRGLKTLDLRPDYNQYISTSYLPRVSERFTDDGILLKIKVAKGMRAILMTKISKFPGEAEILFPRNLRLEITKVTGEKTADAHFV